MVVREIPNILDPRKEDKPTRKVGPRNKGVAEDRELPKEYGGPKGLEPTRYGDWERNGLAVDF